MRLRFVRHLALLAMLTAVPDVLCTTSAAQGRARTVLTIHWGTEDFPGTQDIDAAIRAVLLSDMNAPVNYYAEYLESEEFPAEAASTALRDYIRRKFDGRRIDIILTNGSAALQFALRYRDELFPGVPIVFTAVAVPELTVSHLPTGVNGMVRDFVFGENLELILKLHPSLQRVFVIAQAPAVKGYDELVRSALDRYSDRVELTYIKEPTVPALLAAVRAIPRGSVILYTRYAPIDAARIRYPDEIASLVAEAAPVPTYGASEVYMGKGIVGGVMRDQKETGTALAEMARRMLDGAPPERISKVPTAAMFDWRQVTRWGIDVSRLPPESEILFRTQTAWETYKAYIVGTIVVVTAQLLLIAGLLTQRARRRRAEGTIRTREADLRTSYERIRQLAGRLISAQEATRASIAQDLHDDVCQQLAHVSLDIESLKTSSKQLQDPATERALMELARDTRGALESIRQLSHDLHPASLRIVGLAPALRAHCGEVALRHNVQVAFATDSDLGRLPANLAVGLFRIAQESLRNGIVHGAANHLAVSLNRIGAEVQLAITDNGRGFDLDAARQAGGLGLVSMEERANGFGGEMRIVTGLGKGTTIRVSVPVDPRQDRAADASSESGASPAKRARAIG
jgi:signal transduction histidine kinase